MYQLCLAELDSNLDRLKLVKENGKYTIILLPKESKVSIDTEATIGLRRTAFVHMSQGITKLQFSKHWTTQ